MQATLLRVQPLLFIAVCKTAAHHSATTLAVGCSFIPLSPVGLWKTVLQHEPDVIGFQEVRYDMNSDFPQQRFQVTHLAERLPGYQFIYMPGYYQLLFFAFFFFFC
jgi:hypothetical protein